MIKNLYVIFFIFKSSFKDATSVIETTELGVNEYDAATTAWTRLKNRTSNQSIIICIGRIKQSVIKELEKTVADIYNNHRIKNYKPYNPMI